MGRAMVLAALLALAGCASVITGTSQKIEISTTPAGAKCVLSRENQTIAIVAPTPGVVTVQKDKHDILVSCDEQGYQTGTQYLHSGIEGGTFGNILIGGVIGWGIDSATGADNRYPETASVAMLPAPNGTSTASNQVQTGTTGSASAAFPSQSSPLVYVDCRWKDGSMTVLAEQDCVAKHGTVGGARTRPTAELN